MNPGAEYMRNLLHILDVLEKVTGENILLQELGSRALGSEWRQCLELLRQDGAIQQQIIEEIAWMADAKRRLREALLDLERVDEPEASSKPPQ